MGHLNHACKVVRSGRSFLRRMIDLLHSVPMHPLHPHPIRLNREFRSDLAWWRLFAPEWNGVSFLSPPRLLPMKEIASDASGSWGCGAWHGSRWFQVKWNQSSQPLPIAVKELLPIVLACKLWGTEWEGQLIQCHCDGSLPSIPYKYEQALPAYVACHGIHRGTTQFLPSADIYKHQAKPSCGRPITR